MKHHSIQRVAMGVLLLSATVLLAGCPVDAPQLEPTVVPAGMYWVEYEAGALAVYELPQYRGEAGVWHTLVTAQPEWYTGPALYEVRADGSWTRLTSGDGQTLDDVLQTYDAPPRAESSSL